MGRGGLGIEECVLPSYDALVEDEDAMLLQSLGISGNGLGQLYAKVEPLPPKPEPTVFYFRETETDDEVLRDLRIRSFMPKTHDEYVADDDAQCLKGLGIKPRKMTAVCSKTDLDLHRIQALEQYLCDASVPVPEKLNRLLDYIAWAQRPDQQELSAAIGALFPYMVETIRAKSTACCPDTHCVDALMRLQDGFSEQTPIERYIRARGACVQKCSPYDT